MAAEYSNTTLQTVAQGDNVLFENGSRACTKGYITHRTGSGVFRIKGANGGCRALYRVTFNGNIAIATGGTVEPITVALQEDGETINNAVVTVTPAAAGDFFNVSFDTFIPVTYGCCVSVAVKNISTTTAISVANANLIFTRVA